MKGWRTIAYGLFVAIAPAALTYLASVDWTKIVDPNIAMMIAGAVTVGLRLITTTAPGKSA